MPKLMDKNDWIQTVANVSAAERVWSEQISTDDGVFSMPGLESGTYQVIFVKIDSQPKSTPSKRKSAHACFGRGERMKRRRATEAVEARNECPRPNISDYIGYCQQFNPETRPTDEIMKELREGEE